MAKIGSDICLPYLHLHYMQLDSEPNIFLFQHSYQRSAVACGKKKQWRPLKQILQTEQNLPWPAGEADSLHYWSMDAPPSFRPSKKFSDVSGLESKYTDPQTKLNYSSTTEFKIIRKLPSDIVSGYLTLRKANIQLQ